ncbi:hypothetical protein JXA84_00065 [candidate division WOR-3 bacterium]|nr:hypothetical protein [candidate division WOR-3 bacterium]
MEKIVSIVKKAGKIALQYGENLSVKQKSMDTALDAEKSFFEEKSVVTEADLAVQDYLISEISKEYPGKMDVIAEEISSFYPKNAFLSWCKIEKYTLLIDPIDGTKNYADWTKDRSKKSKLWAVSLCVLKNTDPFFGIMHFPCLGEDSCIITGKGKKTLFNNTEIRINSDKAFNENDVGRISTVMGESGRKLNDFLQRNSFNPGSFTGTFLALLLNTSFEKAEFYPLLKELPPYAFYAGKNIDILDLSCSTLAYKEAGGLVCDSSGKEINPFDFVVKNEARSAFIVDKNFFFFPGKLYFKTIDGYCKKTMKKNLQEFLE